MKSIELNTVFAIPLDISDVLDTKSYARNKPENISSRFAFCIVINVKPSIGMKVLISDYTSSWTEEVSSEIFDNLILPPEVISFSVLAKKRWREVKCQDLERFSHSENSDIELPVTVWFGSQIERKILEEIDL